MGLTLHWFRRDLRLADNAALAAAGSGPIVPVFIFDPALLASARVGAPRLAFLLAALAALDADLHSRGARLIVGHGQPREVLRQLLVESGAARVSFNLDYGPYARRRDAAILASLPASAHHDLLLHPPGDVLTRAETPYTVFTPFKHSWLALPKPAPFNSQSTFTTAGLAPGSLPSLADLGFALPSAFPLPPAAPAAAQRRLAEFAAGALRAYAAGRNALAHDGTSRLSIYLRLGLLSIRQAFAAADDVRRGTPDLSARASVEAWISELAWREFYFHLLHFFPHVINHSLRPAYDRFPWRHAPGDFAAWQAGRTGYPLVDAAMRQLTQTGWMPNRARMIVASFLCKHLLIDWRLGERHFMQTLLDGDTAANNGGWQWTAGSGADAQPFFRIFNPLLQAAKFDPAGDYVRRWLPELQSLPAPLIHRPWDVPAPPPGYPRPIVDHAFARQRALAALRTLRP
jgi:deoxyribodipyrimidine photo-lyase